MSVKKRNGIWQVSFRYNGHRVRQSAGKGATRKDALEKEAQLLTELKKGNRPDPAAHTLCEALVLWIQDHIPTLSESNRVRAKSRARRTRPYIEGVKLIDAPAAAKRMKRAMREEGLQPATVNGRLGVIRGCLEVAKEEGWIDRSTRDDLLDDLDDLPLKNERHVYLSRDDVMNLAFACDNLECARAVVLASYTGLRKSELLSIDEDKLTEAGHIYLGTDTKSGRPRTVPLPDDIRDTYLRPLPLNTTYDQLRNHWEEARRRCLMEHVHWHDLRHTYASWLLTAGANIATVRDILGHADLRTTSRYISLLTDHLVADVKKLSTQAST